MIRRLRLKFVCITMTLVTIMLMLILAMQYRSAQTSLETISLQTLQNASMQTGIGSRPGRTDRDAGQPCFILAENLWGGLVVVADTDYFDLTDAELLKQIYLAAKESGETIGVLDAYSLRFLRRETPVGTGYVFTDITWELQALSELAKSCLFIGAAAFLCFLGISILLAHWAVRPVERAWEQQRRFVADASHELKTPLTVILTNAELLEDPRYDSQARETLIEGILSMSRQMRGLVENLLQLARADSGQTKLERQALDFSKLVSDSVLPFEPLYFEQGLELQSVIEPGITLTGSRQHLTQVLDILLDNAQKYSAAGAAVELKLTRQGHGKCLLRLFSPGAPLSEEACRDIFKRFYRADEARSMPGSFGLGLAIAQEIVHAHRGKIWAEPDANGNVFYVSLPV